MAAQGQGLGAVGSARNWASAGSYSPSQPTYRTATSNPANPTHEKNGMAEIRQCAVRYVR